jgi:microcystin-dependent protein
MSEPFLAEIRVFGFNFAPKGWAKCDGQLLPISQNTALFSLIGTTYGGDGRTTTALPNLQGRAAMAPGRGPGLTPRRLGENTGTDTVTLNTGEMGPHTHRLSAFTAAPADLAAPGPTRTLAASEGGNAYGGATNLADMAASVVRTGSRCWH